MADTNDGDSKKPVIIIIDLKGTKSLFHSLRLLSDKVGYKFRWFTTTLGHSSFGYNPLRILENQSISVLQVAQIIRIVAAKWCSTFPAVCSVLHEFL